MPDAYHAPNLQLFVQVKCSSSPERLEQKQQIGYTIAAIGVVLVLSFQCFMEYTFIQLRNMNQKLDDVVLTADDFTATIDIPEKVWKVHTETFTEKSDMQHGATNLSAFT